MKTKISLSVMLLLAACFTLSAEEICSPNGSASVNNSVSINNNEYIIHSNVWGATTAQCINVNGTGFTVTKSEHNSSGGNPASYPSIYKGCHWDSCTTNSGMPIQVNQIKTATIDWSNTIINSGKWNVTSEAWFKKNSTPGAPDGAELMIWINSQGGPVPGGSQIGTANIAGYSWTVHYASIGWNFITYKLNSPVNSIKLDYKPFIDDAKSRGYIQDSWYMMAIEAGFEIWQGGTGLALNSFSAAVNQGTVTPTPTPARTATRTATPQQTIGDVNNDGNINIVDALMIAQYSVGLNPINFNPSRADTNCDGNINIVDALIIAQYTVGTISRFC